VRALDIEAYHPITLEHIEYIDFSFSRLSQVIEPPLLFPDFEVNIIESRPQEQLRGLLAMQVATKPPPTGEDAEAKVPVLSFSFTLVAYFSCAEFDGAQDALQKFMDADTPSLIAWPYVRGFIADMVNRAGLPGYHLPLLQIRTPTDSLPMPNLAEPAAGE
jgi:hypothetical protein